MGKEHDLGLAIDSGTQNVKAAVYDLNGKELALSRLSHEPDSAPFPRWAEHDPEDYWEKMCSVVREALTAIGPDAKKIKAVGLTSQRGTTIPIDKDGKPLRPAIIYRDNRITEGLPPVRGVWGLIFKVAGKYTAIEYVRAHSRFLWIKKYEPEIYNRTYKFMQVASFLNYRLTGEINESIAMMVGMFPIDYKKFKFYTQKGIHDIFGVTPAQLPELKRPQSVMGYITKEASQKTMIPEGIPVIVGGGDVQSAMVGMGGTDEKCASLVLGSTVVFVIPSKKLINDKQIRFLPWPSAIPDNYILETGIVGGFLTVTWFKNELAHYEALLSKESGKLTEEFLDDAIRNIPSGSLGLIVHPYWAPPFHCDEARGSILGITMAHSRAHIYRAILEGLAYEIKAGYDVIFEKTGIAINEIRVSGGGSNSDMVLSIIADVFQVPAIRMKQSESAALGAAICAAAGSGLFPGFREGIEKMVHQKDRFEPNSKNRAVYETMYKCYQDFYPRVADLYRKTERIASPKE